MRELYHHSLGLPLIEDRPEQLTITAGLMNLLLMLDAYDIAEGRKE